MTRFVVDCETLLQADVLVTSDRGLAQAVSGLVETATIDALRAA